MPTITYVEHDGTIHTVDAPTGRSLMQIATSEGIPGILGDCGGSCSCATCHCYVDEAWLGRLPPPGETEVFMLEAALEPRENSRLCCQLQMTEALDGMVVHLPAEQA